MITFGNIITYIFLILAILMLHMFLSKRQSKWPGLIMPIISFMTSLTRVLYSTITVPASPVFENIMGIISGLIFTNIPTAILILSYFSMRKKVKKTSELDKLNIQDLN